MGVGVNKEMVTCISEVENVVTLSAPLFKAHAVGDELEFSAAAWAGSHIFIAEGNTSLMEVKWTLLHKVGHTSRVKRHK